MAEVFASSEARFQHSRESQFGQSRFLSKNMLIDTARWLELCLNAIAAYAIYYIYVSLYVNNSDDASLYFLLSSAVLVCLYLGLKRIGYYESFGSGQSPTNFALLLTVTFSFCAPLFVLFLFKSSSTLSRVWFLSWLCSVVITSVATRHIWNRLFKLCAKHGYLAHKIVLVGGSEALRRAKEYLWSDGRVSDVRLMSVYDLDADDSGDVEDEGSPLFQQMLNDCRTYAVDEVIIALPTKRSKHLDRTIKTVKLLPTTVSIFFDYPDQNLKLYNVKTVGGMQAVSIQRPPIPDWGRFAKSVFDYTIAAAAILTFLPLMLFIALAIKLDSRGPVLFQQRRQGLNGKVIKVLKFRTMTVMEDGETVRQVQKNDQRVTRVGRILRQTSLDELPQLLNVLKGDMSVVGPRPHAIAHNTYYENLLDTYSNRYRVKPGITGWAQVNGFRGEVKDQKQMEDRVKLDIEYIDNWNFWFDIYILLITPFYGIVSRNAY